MPTAHARPASNEPEDSSTPETAPANAEKATSESRRTALRDVVPWSTPMTRTDKVLIICTLGAIALMSATIPFRPLLIADHPVGLSAVTGGLPTIAAGAAFARIGEESIVLVVLAGIFGMVKFDWLFWLAGRTWGPKSVQFFTPGRYAQRFAKRLEKVPRWVVGLLVILAYLPGVPGLLVHLFAGLSGMRLRTFLAFDIAGAAIVTGTVVGIGHAMGQSAVDIVLAVDEYSLWITIAILAVGGYLAGSAARKRHAEESQDTNREGPEDLKSDGTATTARESA